MRKRERQAISSTWQFTGPVLHWFPKKLTGPGGYYHPVLVSQSRILGTGWLLTNSRFADLSSNTNKDVKANRGSLPAGWMAWERRRNTNPPSIMRKDLDSIAVPLFTKEEGSWIWSRMCFVFIKEVKEGPVLDCLSLHGGLKERESN